MQRKVGSTYAFGEDTIWLLACRDVGEEKEGWDCDAEGDDPVDYEDLFVDGRSVDQVPLVK